jgi:hypothetical protein
MYECECAYRSDDNGARVFVLGDEMVDATDTICDLRVRFAIAEIYPAEPDVGAGMDWNGDIDTIEIRTQCWRRWKKLNGDERAAAQSFLLLHFGAQLWQAGYEYAEAVHYGEVA